MDTGTATTSALSERYERSTFYPLGTERTGMGATAMQSGTLRIDAGQLRRAQRGRGKLGLDDRGRTTKEPGRLGLCHPGEQAGREDVGPYTGSGGGARGWIPCPCRGYEFHREGRGRDKGVVDQQILPHRERHEGVRPDDTATAGRELSGGGRKAIDVGTEYAI